LLVLLDRGHRRNKCLQIQRCEKTGAIFCPFIALKANVSPLGQTAHSGIAVGGPGMKPVLLQPWQTAQRSRYTNSTRPTTGLLLNGIHRPCLKSLLVFSASWQVWCWVP